MDLEILGRLRAGSNMVFLATDPAGDRWIHKPVRGESSLHDFPAGILPPAAADPKACPAAQIAGTLAAREVATYAVARAAGWDVVPETVAVVTAAGPGMAQRLLEHPANDPADDDQRAIAVDVRAPEAVGEGMIPVLALEDENGRPLVLAHADHPRLRCLALLDAVVNNTDRKGGHLLTDSTGTFWGIDHGLSFHTVPKVRSVLWGFTGREFEPAERGALERLATALTAGDLAAELAVLLDPAEVGATERRIAALLDDGRFPGPTRDFPLPWPLF